MHFGTLDYKAGQPVGEQEGLEDRGLRLWDGGSKAAP